MSLFPGQRCEVSKNFNRSKKSAKLVKVYVLYGNNLPYAVILQCSFSVTDITDTLSDGISPFLNFIKHTVRSESDGAITQSLDSELDDNNLCFSTDSALTSPLISYLMP